MIRVLIADDHALVRAGLKQVFAETADISLTGEATNGVEAVRMATSGHYDAVLLDISMPERDGIEALKLIRKESPRLPVLMLSSHSERQFALRAMKAGASGYLNKHSEPQQVIAAIRHVAAGRKYLSPEVAEELAASIGMDTDKPPHETLSDREYQVMCLIASGQNLTAIAERLALSPKTVSVYRARILEKMRLANNAEITHYALKNNLLEHLER